jgi:hypothetical protein
MLTQTQNNSSLVETPSSNTGLKCQDSTLVVSPDYLQFVVKLPSVLDFMDLCSSLEAFFDDSFTWALDSPSVHGRRFESSGRSVRGIMACFNPPTDQKNFCDCWVSLPGSVVSHVPASDFYDLCRSLAAFDHFAVTRFDVALDDYDKSIELEQVLEAAEAGNFAGSRYCDPRIPLKRGTLPGSLGWCVYFGSPQSDKRLRFYNKAAESNGELDCYRWEVQFRAKHANEAFKTYIETESDPMILAGLVTGCVSFVDRESGDRLSRQSFLPWWSEFLDKVGGFIKIRLPRFVPTIQRSKQWINRQVSTTLAAIRQVYGAYFKEWLDQQLHEGEMKLKDRHNNMIKVAKHDWLYPPACSHSNDESALI